jgi:hypothetical protein
MVEQTAVNRSVTGSIPVSPATKLHMVMELYNSGLICKCSNWAKTDNDDESVEMLIHEKDCIGKEEIRKLIGFSQ